MAIMAHHIVLACRTAYVLQDFFIFLQKKSAKVFPGGVIIDVVVWKGGGFRLFSYPASLESVPKHRARLLPERPGTAPVRTRQTIRA